MPSIKLAVGTLLLSCKMVYFKVMTNEHEKVDDYTLILAQKGVARKWVEKMEWSHRNYCLAIFCHKDSFRFTKCTNLFKERSHSKHIKGGVHI